eukprot:10317245-Lingulodinium_polyedra.AAC.1
MASREPLALAIPNPDPKTWKWPRADSSEAHELFVLACDWAEAGRLGVTQTGAPPWLWIRVNNVYKSATQDRQILDRRGRNGAEALIDF